MAEVTTTKTLQPAVAPFSVPGRRENTNIPWGVLSHVTNFSAPQVGTGDTGKVNINLILPQNYWFQLSAFHIDMSSTSTPTWDDGVMRAYYTGSNALNPGFSQQEIYFPLAVTSEASIGTTQYKNVGVAAGGAQSAYDVNSPVNFIMTTNPDANYYAVQLYSNPNSHATDFRVAISFKMYDISQNNHPWLTPY